ncbi:MAG TPA: DUF167 family protein [Bauldia sp.]|nr:DUF167 family protein [Bauldia sp.]
MACYRVEPGAIVLNVRLTPRAAEDSIGGVMLRDDGREFVQIHVRARPENGEANDALVRLLARTFRVPRTRVELVSGATARLKQVRVAGEPFSLGAVVASWKGEG